MNRFLTLAIITTSGLIVLPPCGARTWFVSADGSGDAPTIQAAADSSSPGDTLLAGPGTFVEQVDLTKSVTLKGWGGTATTIDADTGQTGYCVRALGWSLDVLIESLRFQGALGSAYGYGGYAILAEGAATIRDCTFENEGYGAIVAYGDLTLRDSSVRLNGRVHCTGSSLVIEGCLFEDVDSYGGPAIVQLACGVPATALVSRNTFRDNDDGAAMIGYDHLSVSLALELSSNLFAGNAGPAVAFAPLPVTAPRTRGGSVALEIRENTIARHAGHTIGWDRYPFGSWGIETIAIRRNSITGGGFGPYFEENPPPLTIECNDVWADGVNWTGIPDPTGENGNISEEPKYCGAATGDFTVATNSPLRATNNSCHVQIGAFGVGCGPLSVEAATWGHIKALYR